MGTDNHAAATQHVTESANTVIGALQNDFMSLTKHTRNLAHETREENKRQFQDLMFALSSFRQGQQQSIARALRCFMERSAAAPHQPIQRRRRSVQGKARPRNKQGQVRKRKPANEQGESNSLVAGLPGTYPSEPSHDLQRESFASACETPE